MEGSSNRQQDSKNKQLQHSQTSSFQSHPSSHVQLPQIIQSSQQSMQSQTFQNQPTNLQTNDLKGNTDYINNFENCNNDNKRNRNQSQLLKSQKSQVQPKSQSNFKGSPAKSTNAIGQVYGYYNGMINAGLSSSQSSSMISTNQLSMAKRIYKLKPVNKVTYRDNLSSINSTNKLLIGYGQGGSTARLHYNYSRINTGNSPSNQANPQQDDIDSRYIQSQLQQIQEGQVYQGSQTQRRTTNFDSRGNRVQDIQIKQLSRQKQTKAQSLNRAMNQMQFQQQQLAMSSIQNIQSNLIQSQNNFHQNNKIDIRNLNNQALTAREQQSQLDQFEQENNQSTISGLTQQPFQFTNEFLVKQRERQQKESEVQLMLNRIKLLEQEEEKIRKKIDLTKRKATEIMTNKTLNEQKQRDKLQLQEEQGQQLEEQRIKNEQLREQLRSDVAVKQKEIQERLIQEARERKKMRQQNEQSIKEHEQQVVMVNKGKRDKIKELEEKQKEAMEKLRQSKEEMNKGMQEARVSAENDKVKQADQLLKELELREQAIIERLKQTQNAEGKAKQLLINAIQATSTSKKARVQSEISHQTSQIAQPDFNQNQLNKQQQKRDQKYFNVASSTNTMFKQNIAINNNSNVKNNEKDQVNSKIQQ